jgi:hypothetical protein
LLHGAMLALGDAPMSERPLGGADAYSRLTQVLELQAGGWHRDTVSRSNAPFGEPRVWSRAFDLLLWPGAAALAPLTGFARGLHLWGVLLPPLLHAIALAALLWAAAPLARGPALLYLGLLFPFQVSVTAQFLAGRPDHHPLLGLLFVLVLGAALRLIAGAGYRLAVLAGLALAAALWVSVESLVLAAALLAGLAAAWAKGRARAADVLVVVLAAALAIAAALTVERPPAAWAALEYDRLSAVHLTLFMLLALAWFGLCAIERSGAWGDGHALRWFAVALGVALVGGLQYLLLPKFFAGPMADVAPVVRALNLERTAEYGAAIDPRGLAASLHLLLLYLSGPLAAALALPWLIARAGGRQRDGWLFIAFVGAVYLALALYQIRWGMYAALAALPACALLLVRLGDLAAEGAARAALRFAAFAILAVGLTVFGWMLRPDAGGTATISKQGRCDIAAISRLLMRQAPYADAPRTLINFPYDGPELLYRTHHRVVATPNHRNGAGLADAHDFFAAADADAARYIAMRRRVDLVLICADLARRPYYGAGGGEILWDRLRLETPPDWLRPVHLPAELGDWKLYEVRS